MIVFSLHVCRFYLPRKDLDHHLNILKFRTLKDACHVLLKIAQWIWRFFFKSLQYILLLLGKGHWILKIIIVFSLHACRFYLPRKGFDKLWTNFNTVYYSTRHTFWYSLMLIPSIPMLADSYAYFACLSWCWFWLKVGQCWFYTE